MWSRETRDIPNIVSYLVDQSYLRSFICPTFGEVWCETPKQHHFYAVAKLVEKKIKNLTCKVHFCNKIYRAGLNAKGAQLRVRAFSSRKYTYPVCGCSLTSVNHPGPPLRAINSRVNTGLKGMSKISLRNKIKQKTYFCFCNKYLCLAQNLKYS